MERKKIFDISSAGLHIIAMLFMTLDHLWATVLSDFEWLTCAGRIAFPIFAFLIAEGYRHTSDFRKYLLRLLIAAFVSEIPFNLITSNRLINPVHQNVLWTFIIALICIRIIDKAKQRKKLWLTGLTMGVTALVGYVIGMITMVDYHGAGVLTVLVFYVLEKKKWWSMLCQVLLLWWINTELIGGLFYPVELFGYQFELLQQSFALLSLVPIWLYNGRLGIKSRAFQYTCYAFYPAHMLLLVVIAKLLDILN